MIPPILLIDKPKGMSSFSVLRELRWRTGYQKFGHAGTLDPRASGLLLVGVNKGTKLLTGLVGLDKWYTAVILIGERRTTGDMEGDIVEERPYIGDRSQVLLEETLEGMLGELQLPVPVYSAIKQQGVPLYKRARQANLRGTSILDTPKRRMVVYDASLVSVVERDKPSPRCLVTVRFHVSSGTYIRSLAEEYGRRLGYPATLYDLRRTSIGPYHVKDATKLSSFGTMQRVLRRLLLRLFRRLGRRASS